MSELVGTWTVTLPGETFTWEPDEMMLSEWADVEEAYGGTFMDWVNAIDAREAKACQVLIWWLRRRKGIDIDLDAVDFKIRQLTTTEIKDPPSPEDVAAASPSAAATSEPSPDAVGDLATSTP